MFDKNFPNIYREFGENKHRIGHIAGWDIDKIQFVENMIRDMNDKKYRMIMEFALIFFAVSMAYLSFV